MYGKKREKKDMQQEMSDQLWLRMSTWAEVQITEDMDRENNLHGEEKEEERRKRKKSEKRV